MSSSSLFSRSGEFEAAASGATSLFPSISGHIGLGFLSGSGASSSSSSPTSGETGRRSSRGSPAASTPMSLPSFVPGEFELGSLSSFIGEIERGSSSSSLLASSSGEVTRGCAVTSIFTSGELCLLLVLKHFVDAGYEYMNITPGFLSVVHGILISKVTFLKGLGSECVENYFIEFMLNYTAQHNTSIARFPGLFKRRLGLPHEKVELAFETLPCDYYKPPVESGTEEPVESELESETEDDELEHEEGMYIEDSTEDEYDTLPCDYCIAHVQSETEEPVEPETEEVELELEQGMDIEDSTEDEYGTDDDSDDMEYNEEKPSFGSFIMDAPLVIGNSGGDARISDLLKKTKPKACV